MVCSSGNSKNIGYSNNIISATGGYRHRVHVTGARWTFETSIGTSVVVVGTYLLLVAKVKNLGAFHVVIEI